MVAPLKAKRDENSILYCWEPGGSDDNPHLALLGQADRFIVTGDSVSMMVEVARRGKPLAIFALPYQRDLATRLRRGLTGARPADAAQSGNGGWTARLLASFARSGIAGYSRDLTAIHDFLYQQQLAVPLGTPFLAAGYRPPDELERVVSRVRRLITAP